MEPIAVASYAIQICICNKLVVVLVIGTRLNDKNQEGTVHSFKRPFCKHILYFTSEVLSFKDTNGDVYCSDVMDTTAILIGGPRLPVSAPFIWNKFVRCVWVDPVFVKGCVHNVAKKLKLENTKGLWQRAAPAPAVSKKQNRRQMLNKTVCGVQLAKVIVRSANTLLATLVPTFFCNFVFKVSEWPSV